MEEEVCWVPSWPGWVRASPGLAVLTLCRQIADTGQVQGYPTHLTAPNMLFTETPSGRHHFSLQLSLLPPFSCPMCLSVSSCLVCVYLYLLALCVYLYSLALLVYLYLWVSLAFSQITEHSQMQFPLSAVMCLNWYLFPIVQFPSSSSSPQDFLSHNMSIWGPAFDSSAFECFKK